MTVVFPIPAHVQERLTQGGPLTLSGWTGASRALVLTRLVVCLNRPLLVIVNDEKEALTLTRDFSFFSCREFPVSSYPSLEVLPYYQLSPHPDRVAQRLGLLRNYGHGPRPFVIIASLPSLCRKTIPKEIFDTATMVLTKFEQVNRDQWLDQMTQAAYQRVPLVEDMGTFAVRGSLVDVFSPSEALPCRVEFDGDLVEAIRLFDPQTQKSLKEVDQVELCPAREILMGHLGSGWSLRLKQLADHHDVKKTDRDVVCEHLKGGIYFSGIESFLPLFYPRPGVFFDYLPRDTIICYLEREVIEGSYKDYLESLAAHRIRSNSVERIFQPQDLHLTLKELIQVTSGYSELNVSDRQGNGEVRWSVEMASNSLLKGKIDLRPHGEALTPLVAELQQKNLQDIRVTLVTGSKAQTERIHDLLKPYPISLILPSGDHEIKDYLEGHPQRPGVGVLSGPISSGFLWPEGRQWWVTDEEIFGKKIKKAAPSPKGEVFSSFSELEAGDYVVHEHHGVGIYRGLKSLQIQKATNDFLLIEYLGGDKLFVPVDQLHRIWRYSAQEGAPPLVDRMGGTSWRRVREKVQRATRRLARALLEIQAHRQLAKGFSFSIKNSLFEEFEATFSFEETEDQLQAIEDVMTDMEGTRPMDRLVCGDVGYGKTEVAIRAAFKAVLDSKQVAVLVPTTVLAFQHYETFQKRFRDYPVRVALLSRFQDKKEQGDLVEQLRQGQVDVVIGTHRLLSRDIHFRDLGLLVIDEEQRFGVAQKERIKRLKAVVDVLALSATPIPRTLNFAMLGIRDLSLIQTPPADRLSIRTFVTPFEEGTIREAILHEIKRGGQVYFVHNRVESIQAMAHRLSRIVPEVALRIAHGQMNEKELESVMIDFMGQKFPLLLCSTIIESGLDIPTVNTIIINRADHMGLAQLYQLRGRVGRSYHRASCYLLIPHQSLVTESAKKRLHVVSRFTELGSGFKIASHDLEIRGAGNILGAEQSGHMAAVGYDFYMKLLEEAVRLQRGGVIEEEVETEIKLPISALIPDSLVPDTQMRLALYKQLSPMKTEDGCLKLREEWIDRLGPLPPQTENLILLIRLKVVAMKIKISSVSFQKDSMVFQIHPSCPIPTEYFVKRVKELPRIYKILPEGKFVVLTPFHSEAQLLEDARRHLLDMSGAIMNGH